MKPLNHKQEVFGVVWTDHVFGPLTLSKKTAEEAIKTAVTMRESGVGKIEHCRAVRVPAGRDEIVYLD